MIDLRGKCLLDRDRMMRFNATIRTDHRWDLLDSDQMELGIRNLTKDVSFKAVPF